jgi:hypothetical protein
MSHSELKQLHLYKSLMEEAKVRIACINMATQGRTGLPNPIAREFCYLQIRFLCELVSLACLVAHGDITGLQSREVGKTYSADDILKRMSNLRPHFYPVALRSQVLPPRISGQVTGRTITAIEPPPLNRDKLLALYADAHKYVHRGSLRELLLSKHPLDPVFDISDVVSKAQPLAVLLSHHFIAISEAKVMLCVLNNIDDNNSVQVLFAERPLPDIGPINSILTL